ncbi:hypothetical protein JCM14469_23170 [Desulfatiferula olefinivorans]
MNKLNALTTGVLGFLALAFFTLIVYVSILGDNHKIDDLVTRFFNDLKNRNYDALCTVPGDVSGIPALSGDDACPQAAFLFELAFLSRFGLLDKGDYSVEIKRDHFWIPYVTDDRIRISVAFTEKKKNLVHELFYGIGSDNFVRDIMWVERRKGQWVIAEVTLKASTLYPLYTELSGRIDLERFIRRTDEGFVLKANDIRPAELDPVDRRLLEFSLSRLKARP